MTDFANSDNSNLNDDIFANSEILNFYLPFVKNKPKHLLSLFTALECINFMEHGETIWLPPCWNIPNLNELMLHTMDELYQEDNNYVRIETNNLNAIINKVRFYTENQIERINNQYIQFYNFFKNNHLQNYSQYINCTVPPQNLSPQEWNYYVIPLKNAAMVLARTMFPMQVIPRVQGNR